MNRITEKSIPEPNSGCWIWLGNIQKSGHGRLKWHGHTTPAHRVSWAHFSYVMKRTGFPRQVVRRICRHLARSGMAEYSRGLWSEDGKPAGAGYAITKVGRAALEHKP
jgi:hypothetical protein